MKTQVKNN